jgi:transcriptional regulator with XRE-family HTH domain
MLRERLKARRLELGMTPEQVAEAIGVEKPTVQRYESGVIKKIDNITVEKLADALRCSPLYLMGWDEQDEKKARHK